jgi:hypothetical protein
MSGSLKSVPDFIPDHIGSREVLVLGMNPSTKKKPIKNGTFCRLRRWMTEVGIPHWDFHNVVPQKVGDCSLTDVDWDLLKEKVKGRKVVICLGVFVARVVKGVVDPDVLILIDHPSPRNRNFNDPGYEISMLSRLKKSLKEILK